MHKYCLMSPSDGSLLPCITTHVRYFPFCEYSGKIAWKHNNDQIYTYLSEKLASLGIMGFRLKALPKCSVHNSTIVLKWALDWALIMPKGTSPSHSQCEI